MSARMLAPTGRRSGGSVFGGPVVGGSGVGLAVGGPVINGPSGGSVVGGPGVDSSATAARPAGVHRGRRSGGASLHIDWTACDGRGLCTELLPELLRRDEWGYPIALRYGSDVPVPLALHAAAADAVALCPRLALTIRRPA